MIAVTMMARSVRVFVSTFDKDGLNVTEDFSVSSRREEKTNMGWERFDLR